MWEIFVDEGIDPRVAFIMAHSFSWGAELKVKGLGASSHSGFHDFPQWWAKNYYEGSWRGKSYPVGVADGKLGYGEQVGLGRPGVSIGLTHPKRDTKLEQDWNRPKGYGFFDVLPGMDYKEVLGRILEDVNREDAKGDEIDE